MDKILVVSVLAAPQCTATGVSPQDRLTTHDLLKKGKLSLNLLHNIISFKVGRKQLCS